MVLPMLGRAGCEAAGARWVGPAEHLETNASEVKQPEGARRTWRHSIGATVQTLDSFLGLLGLLGFLGFLGLLGLLGLRLTADGCRLPVDIFVVFCVKVVKIQEKCGNQAVEWG